MTSFKWKTDDVSGRMYFQKLVDRNMLKHNEDEANYANSKRRVFEVRIM